MTIDWQDQQARDKTVLNDEEKYNTKLVPDYVLKIKVKVDGNPAIALVDNQTIGRDLISIQYCNTYNIPTYVLKKAVQIYLVLKGSKGTTKRFCRIKLEWEGHSENRLFYVAALDGYNMILGKQVLKENRALIDCNNDIVVTRPKLGTEPIVQQTYTSIDKTKTIGIVAVNITFETDSE